MLIARLSNETERDRRGHARRIVALGVNARTGDAGYYAIIRNLSENGLMLETEEALGVGDVIQCTLPNSGDCAAEIVWARQPNYGCRFFAPISKADVSAAILASTHAAPSVGGATRAKVAQNAKRKRHGATPAHWAGLLVALGVLIAVVALV